MKTISTYSRVNGGKMKYSQILGTHLSEMREMKHKLIANITGTFNREHYINYEEGQLPWQDNQVSPAPILMWLSLLIIAKYCPISNLK